MENIALVTGANRGLGFETCRQLAGRRFHVLLTSRDPNLGQEAACVLRGEGLQVTYHPLDVTSLNQVDTLCQFVTAQYGRLDVLVNNAGVSLDGEAMVLDVAEEVFEATLAVNLYGTLRTIRGFVPLMKSHNYRRVVNVSSAGGSLSAMTTQAGRMAAYRTSKAALNAITRLAASAVRDYDIKINAMCPGWVRTRMGGSRARRTIAQGVDTIVWLATLPASGPTGGFFKDRKRHPW